MASGYLEVHRRRVDDGCTCPATGHVFSAGDVALAVTGLMKGCTALLAPTAALRTIRIVGSAARYSSHTCAATGAPLPKGQPVVLITLPVRAGPPIEPASVEESAPTPRSTRSTRSSPATPGTRGSAGSSQRTSPQGPQGGAGALLFSLAAAAPLLTAVLAITGNQVDSIPGWAALSAKHQAAVKATLGAAGIGSHTDGSNAGAGSDASTGGALPERDVRTLLVAGGSPVADASGVKAEQPQEVPDAAGALRAAASISDDALEFENEFERQRAEHIARNRSRMAALALPQLAATVAPARPPAPSHKGVGGQKRSRAKAEPAEPVQRRASLRQRRIAADPVLASGVAAETSRGGVLLAASTGERSIWNSGPADPSGAAVPSGDVAQPVGPKERHPSGPVPFTSDNGSEVSDAAFLAFLKQHLAAGAGQGGSTPPAHHPGVVTAKNAAKLRLDASDVAKVTKDGVTHCAWHPDPRHLLIAAGDKGGRIALWQVDHPGEGADGFDGVAMFTAVHNAYVCGVKWMTDLGGGGSPNHLLTASYDGSLRLLDVQQGSFLDLSAGIREDMEISAVEVDPSSQIAYLADNEGGFEVIDLRVGKAVRPGVALHDKRINELHLEPATRRLLATAGSDGTVRVWDIRHLSAPTVGSPSKAAARQPKPLCELDHKRSSHAGYWAPDGSQRLLTISYDDTLRIWAPQRAVAGDGAGQVSLQLNQSLLVKHDNQTGRYVTPFRPIWGPNCDMIAVGSMKRGIDIFNASNGAQVAFLASEFMTAIPPRLAAHPAAPLLAAATSSGRMHIWRT